MTHRPLPPPQTPYEQRRAEEQKPSNMAQLPGWDAEDHAAAFAAVRAGCVAARDPSLARFCAEARAAGPLGERAARDFLERRLTAEPAEGEGLLTGYFAPRYEARSRPDEEFCAPVRPRPVDPVLASSSRAEIDARSAPDALAWMRPEDLFFLQIQGSGVLTFRDGERMRASFAGSNGYAFVAISGPMAAQGLLPHTGASAGGVHDWLAAHRGREADAVMEMDPRYVFFRLQPDTGAEPAGAAGALLVPGRSVAVDTGRHAYGELLWIDGEAPVLTSARPSYRRLVVALDTGSAIKGDVRADLYLGQGAMAGEEAGRVRHTLRIWRLVPTVGR
jgi:membrane-bound lytic murein transglycosylase A